ncbi:hypothetical protein M378DRAFT_82714 [Amanita muscaria Koide BX008]|uniref:Mitochondrial distribution and morphology protein 12 n=1 Tax=Amanita muscaria (strain Koide BX008) TaxID=946122 RepID=A0A0C2WIE8_AMAMK|nr:hypothetical protein M378DRAFT_82714 [Amanita muscaria Koide BX008]
MSIDLEWNKLDSLFTSYLVDILNRQLANVERPSFIGPVEITSFDFGSAVPDVELVDLRDIYRDFLEDDEEDSERGPVRSGEGADDDEGYEWVSRRAGAAATFEVGGDELRQGLAYQHLPPHVRYRYGLGRPTDMFASVPSLRSPLDPWGTGGAGLGMSIHDFRSPTAPWQATRTTPSRSSTPSSSVHLHVNWHSNLRISLTMSLLINYPSPEFMSLPIRLSVTGLVFNGELAVAYEGERRRAHLSILDDMDPYGPTGDRAKRSTSSASTPPDIDDEVIGIPSRSSKPLPVGQRLLPSIYIESEIGQVDKHVLKNVTRVERFIQDVIRKTVVEELVFPNFHTIILGDS